MMKMQKILVVDDSEMNRSILADMLEDEYEIIEARNGIEAITAIKKQEDEICLVLLDIIMPEMDGFEVLTVMNRGGWIENIPVIMISAEVSSTYVDHAYDLGAVDYINRPFDGKVVRRRVKNTIMLYAKQKMLQGMIMEQVFEKEKNSNLMIEILSNIVEFRNGESGLHVLHIRTITETLLKQLARKTSQYGLTHSRIMMISNASALHDIGKVSIDEKILNKPGKLTDEEFEVIKTHAEIGAEMMKNVPFRQNEELVKIGYDICRWHHERYDGKGYPDGLKGEEIPIAAQVVALADVYDALISERVYKPPFTLDQALSMILNGECGTFNPVLLECLREAKDYIEKELEINSLKEMTQNEMQDITAELIAKGDMTASDRTLRLLEQERIKYQFFASMSQEIQFEYNALADMLIFSEWGSNYLGIGELIMKPFENAQILELVNKDDLDDIRHKVKKTTFLNPIVSSNYLLTINKEKRWCKLVVRALWSGEESTEMTGAIGKFTDIHEEHEKIDSLEKMAAQDLLTNLYNHVNARKQIEQRIQAGDGKKFGMILFDIDYFKNANDQYGHLFGDCVLKYIAGKLMKNIRKEDIAARVGGDEFMVFTEYTGNFEPQASRIFRTLTDYYENFRISVSMGVATYPENGKDYEQLFHCADQALYASKRGGRNQFKFYDDSMRGMLSVLSPID